MTLLIVAQKFDRTDENLGAFAYWFEACARKAGRAIVIADSVGRYELPQNSSAHSLGKDKGKSRLRRLWTFWELFSRYYPIADAVLFHMGPEFVIAASPFTLSLRKPTGLWYAHKSVTWKLRLAERIADHVFTSSPLGFRLPSKKVHAIGQGIDTEWFAPAPRMHMPGGALRMITIGRIAPVKNYELIIRAASLLKDIFPRAPHLHASEGRAWELALVGGPLLPRDHSYLESLKALVRAEGLERHIRFEGAHSFSEIPDLLREYDLFLNVSGTGSMDKAVLEAMASGLTVITANEAYRTLMPKKYFLEHLTPEFLAERIKLLADEPRPNLALRSIVVEHHSLENTVAKMVDILSRNDV